jgi:hypothetical protein
VLLDFDAESPQERALGCEHVIFASGLLVVVVYL